MLRPYWIRLHQILRIVSASSFTKHDQCLFAACAESGKAALETPFASVPSAPLTRRTIYDRVHALLQHLISLVPTLPSTLFPLLVRSFPHKRQTQAEHVTYVRNLLRVGEYCGELWEGVMALVVERTLQIDVSMIALAQIVY